MKYLVECLPRIGCTSIAVHANERPVVASLHPSTLELKTVSGDVSVSIPLPHNVDIKCSYEFKACGDRDYVLRLRNRNEDVVGNRELNKSRNFLMSLPEGKWGKKDLLDLGQFKLTCLCCGSAIIDAENCFKLNEMPSEFWMELMDYWHCHKPDEPTGACETGRYSAKQNSLNPCTKELLVGGSFLLANAGTFTGRVICDGNLLRCSKCNVTLGEKTKEQLYKIYKYNMKLSSLNGEECSFFPPENDIVFTILNHVKGNSARHILLKCEDKKVHVWIFAIDISVTLSDGAIIRNCMKVLYQEDVKVEGNHNIDDATVNHIPMKCFLAALDGVNTLLPKNNAKMGPWNVSYIPMVIE
ncbi:hypothetical protein HG535_0H04170 [Zygotorulaspora mrakii]|uniref:HECT-type E3 ubiquitin transferase E3D n=1 Tax=Zygotorulaspora mrakii TaxID=42260 RepID=A0A7H9B9F7_ZYGMR|nr:uncharacterized protein HG535_0H04170 [Zygotorulaspora mrakii]QLG75090.1 hypothetical protein HG535_0H04170 [Zygotorulaspora mrakii]